MGDPVKDATIAMKSYEIDYMIIELKDDISKSSRPPATADYLTNEDIKCSECMKPPNICHGHTRYIGFKYPIINSLFMKEITNVLKLMCMNCFNPYHGVEDVETRFRQKYDHYAERDILKDLKKEMTDDKLPTCRECANPSRKFVSNALKTNFKLLYTTEGSATQLKSSTLEVRNLLKIMRTRVECHTLMAIIGISPSCNIEEFIPMTILVPPAMDMPAVKTKTNSMDNPLANFMKSLLNISAAMVSVDARNIDEIEQLTSQGSNTYSNIMVDNANSNSKRQISIIPSMSSKTGLTRRGLFSYPNNTFVIRSVITGHMGDIFTVGIPEHMLVNMQYPRLVTEKNLDEMTGLLRQGKIFRVVIEGYEYQQIHYLSKTLRPGLTVMTSCRAGDIVLVSRQPEVHAHSVFPAIVVISDRNDHSIRIATNNTGATNADFDGDEMNVHLPQNLQAEEDMFNLMNSITSIISSGTGSSVVGIQHGGILGLYYLSGSILTPMKYMNALVLITKPAHNTFQNYDDLNPVQYDSTTKMTEEVVELCKLIDESELVSRAAREGLLKTKYLTGTSAYDMLYYYDVLDSEEARVVIGELWDILVGLVRHGEVEIYLRSICDKLGLYGMFVKDIKPNMNSDTGLGVSLMAKLKIMDFLLREHLIDLCKDIRYTYTTKPRKNGYTKVPGLRSNVVTYFAGLYKESRRDQSVYVNVDILKQICDLAYRIELAIEAYVIPMIPGNFVISISIPYYLNYDSSGLKIRNGVIVAGQIKDKHVSTGRNTIHSAILNSKFYEGQNSSDAIKFINGSNRVSMSYLCNVRTYTYSMDDILGNLEEYSNYSDVLKVYKTESYARLNPVLTDINSVKHKELKSQIINAIYMESDKLTETIKGISGYKMMDDYPNSGAKGKIYNNYQITRYIGIVYVLGDIVIYPYELSPRLDNTNLSYTLESYIDGYSSNIATVTATAAIAALTLRHTVLPKSETTSNNTSNYVDPLYTNNSYGTSRFLGSDVWHPEILSQSTGLDPAKLLYSQGHNSFYPVDPSTYYNFLTYDRKSVLTWE